jgi:hypothetical protein
MHNLADSNKTYLATQQKQVLVVEIVAVVDEFLVHDQ